MKRYVTYFRVSTAKQGTSGLGMEAQAEAVSTFFASRPHEVIATFTEVESGKRSDRPELLNALDECRKRKATLVIAKLDRLGRNLAFIANLMESSVEFVCCDNPHANRLMLHMLAAFAEFERELIYLQCPFTVGGVDHEYRSSAALTGCVSYCPPSAFAIAPAFGYFDIIGIVCLICSHNDSGCLFKLFV